jgi:hypothetical protein
MENFGVTEKLLASQEVLGSVELRRSVSVVNLKKKIYDVHFHLVHPRKFWGYGEPCAPM